MPRRGVLGDSDVMVPLREGGSAASVAVDSVLRRSILGGKGVSVNVMSVMVCEE